MATAADVPTKFDVLLNGQGYVFDDAIDPTSIYSSRQRAQFGFTPVFVTRQNVQGDYGDNQQDFWLTFTQRDWSLGEQQRYFRQGDADSVRRYWQGAAVDVTKQGQVLMREASPSLTFTGAVDTIYPTPGADGIAVFANSGVNLYTVSNAGVITDKGAHGLGTTPRRFGVASDGVSLYFTSTGAGTVGVRKWNTAAFSTFAIGTGADCLAFLNNTLYGWRSGVGAAGDLVRWDSAGTLTSLFTWKDAGGTAISPGAAKLEPFGGKLLILRAPSSTFRRAELWLYDGTAPSLVAQFSQDFRPSDLVVSQGVVFVGGTLLAGTKSAIFYYANGSIGKLWEADTTAAFAAPYMAGFRDGIVFPDYATDRLLYYSASSGGVSAIGPINTATSPVDFLIGADDSKIVHSRKPSTGTNTGTYFPGSGAATTSTITTALDDFDSSLDKRFHAIRIDYDEASDGDGGSADVAYRLNDLNGSYTTLATGVTSGAEIDLTNISGRSISIKVTLNKGSSTAGPVLKRIAVRASPVQPQFIIASYILNCTGTAREPESLISLRDGSRSGKTGLEMVADLKAAVASANPISITDPVNGTFTGIIDADSFQLQAVRHMEEFRVVLTVRQV